MLLAVLVAQISLQSQSVRFSAFVIGPDGHNIEAVCHEPEA
jgi:hypothetical protein